MTMSTAAAKPEDVTLAELKKAPEDIEAQAVAKKITAAEKHIKSELCQAIDVLLDDELLPPLEIIVKVVKKMVPKCIVAVKTKLDKCFSNLPCLGFLHLVLIGMMAVHIFYYSVQNVFIQVVVAINKDMANALESMPASCCGCVSAWLLLIALAMTGPSHRRKRTRTTLIKQGSLVP
jgi:hypothetical protein